MSNIQDLKKHLVEGWHLRFKKSGLNQTDIAYKAGVNPSTLSLIMNEHSIPFSSTVKKIERVLKEAGV